MYLSDFMVIIKYFSFWYELRKKEFQMFISNFRKMKATLNFLATCMVLVAMSSCKKEDVTPTNTASSTTSSGTKSLVLNSQPDSSSSNYEHCFIELEKIEAYFSGQGWITISSEPQTIDLNALYGESTALLAQVTDSAFEQMDQIRFTFGTESQVVFNSGSYFGLNFMNNEFQETVAIDHNVSNSSTILFNFNLNGAMIHNALGYFVDPVIEQLQDPATGISGHINTTGQALITMDNSDLMVQTYLDGEGNFKIQDMEPGVYQFTVTPIINGIKGQAEQLQSVVVIEGQTTVISTITL